MTTSDKEAMRKEPGFNFHEVVIIDREKDERICGDGDLGPLISFDINWSETIPSNVGFSFGLFHCSYLCQFMFISENYSQKQLHRSGFVKWHSVLVNRQ